MTPQVFLTKDPKQTGMIIKKVGTNVQVDFSESGGDAMKFIAYKNLSTAQDGGDDPAVEAEPVAEVEPEPEPEPEEGTCDTLMRGSSFEVKDSASVSTLGNPHHSLISFSKDETVYV